jgi:hypothetical protein
MQGVSLSRAGQGALADGFAAMQSKPWDDICHRHEGFAWLFCPQKCNHGSRAVSDALNTNMPYAAVCGD